MYITTTRKATWSNVIHNSASSRSQSLSSVSCDLDLLHLSCCDTVGDDIWLVAWFGLRGSTATALGLVFITNCPLNSTLPSAIEPSRSLLLVSGTICHSTSVLCLLFTSLHLDWKPTSSPFPFQYSFECTVPVKWLSHYYTLIDHLTYLLTYTVKELRIVRYKLLNMSQITTCASMTGNFVSVIVENRLFIVM